MSAIAGSVDNYVKRIGPGIYMRPTQYTLGGASSWTNPMTADEARKVAKRLNELADEAERPKYKPGKVYQSNHGNRYLRTDDNRWVAFESFSTGWAGTTLDDSALSHPLAEVYV